MRARSTRCLSWGQPENARGFRVGGAMVDVCGFDTLCDRPRKDDERLNFEITAICVFDPRPKGVCPACFKALRSMWSAGMGL